MDGWMDGWWMMDDGWMDELVNERMGACQWMNEWENEQVSDRVNEWVNDWARTITSAPVPSLRTRFVRNCPRMQRCCKNMYDGLKM